MNIGRSFDIAFTPDAETAVTISRDVFTWDLTGGRKIASKNMISNPSFVCIEPSGKRCIAKNTSGQLISFTLANLAIVASSTGLGKEGPRPLISPDSRRVIDSSWSGMIQLMDGHDLKPKQQVSIPHSMVSQATMSKNGKEVAFVVTPIRDGTMNEGDHPYVLVSDWKLKTMKRVDFAYYGYTTHVSELGTVTMVALRTKGR